MSTKVYLIPGTMCNEMLWSEISQVVGSNFELIHTPIPSGGSLDDIADSLCDFFPLEKINIVGFSLGAYIGSYFSTKYPDRVAKLFLISNSPCSLNVNELKQRNEIIRWVKNNGYAGISRTKAMSLLDEANQKSHFVDTIIQMDAALGPDVFISQLEGTSQRKDLSSELLNLSIPITFFYSSDDTLVNEKWIKDFNKNNQNCVMVSTSGSGHMLPLEKPVELIEQIKRWAQL